MWVPTDDIYLVKQDQPHVRPHRPLHQGDVFVGVPLSIARRTRDAEGGFFRVRDDATVMLIGAPCSIRAGSRTLPVQSVVEVLPKHDVIQGEMPPFEPPYEGYLHLFALPQLASATDFVANFRRIGTSPTSELVESRVACLNRDGWTALEQRYINHSTRYEVPYDKMFAASVGTWNEVEVWKEWNARGLPEGDFEEWMKQPLGGDSAYAGTIRRDAVAFAPDAVIADIPPPPAA